jgi:uncharacterized repeat protein (TIGR03806 family)
LQGNPLGDCVPNSGGAVASWILAAIAAVGLAGCGGGGSGSGGAADSQPPSRPTGVAAVATGPTAISLSWNASTDAGTGLGGYRLLRDGIQIANGIQVTQWVDGGLQPLTTYSYMVVAYDRASPPNESAPSAAAQASTPASADTTAPSVPTDVQALATGSTSIRLTWSASTDAGSGVAGYEVFRDGGAAPIRSLAATSFEDSGLAAGTSYTYRVRAFDSAVPANYSALSSAATASTSGGGPSGLAARPSNTTCLAPERPVVNATASFVRAYPNLAFNQPIALVRRPGDASRWYVAEKTGRVLWFVNSAATSTATVALDISPLVVDPDAFDERGFLGLAFHPGFASNGKIYVNYVTSGPQRSRISEFTSADGGNSFDPGSERVLLEVNQPADNHNGGNLAFGPDGYLYAGFGDGGGANDFYQNGQRMTTVLGKMIRIDPDSRTGTAQYGIPGDNPHAGNPVCNATDAARTATCPEIWTVGMRNPWRWTFDRETGELWVGDVMQDNYEEINLISRGANYGWPIRQGQHCFPTGTAGCATAGLTDPVAELPRNEGGTSIVAGFVYRGTAVPEARGRLVFTDAGSGIIGSVRRDPQGNFLREMLNTNADYSVSYVSFGEAADGEMYAVSLRNGTIHKLELGVSAGGGSIPTSLLATGCVDPDRPTEPSSGLIPYAPVAPFWSDGAVKERWIGLPDGTRLTVQPDGDWDFPPGTVLMKNFRLDNLLIETRLFMKHPDGIWGGYSYEWNDSQTDATLVVGTKNRIVGTQTWVYPNQAQCFQCHTFAAGSSLGLETPQLNALLTYPQTGITANQVYTLNHIAVLAPPVTADPAVLPRYFDPYETGGTLAERARSYLHVNCSQCHRPGGPTPISMDLRYSTTLAATNACDVVPRASLGIPNARIIAAGSADRSVLLARMSRRDQDAMPPLASTVVDSEGVALVTEWINSLSGCQ